jgi:type IV secretory pathway VirB2 component (pilin)
VVSANRAGTRQTTPLLLVVVGLIACGLAEWFGYRDLVTIAVATNAAGLALLTQNHTQVTNKDGGKTEITSPAE